MGHCERKSVSGAPEHGQAPVAELKSALTGFLKDVAERQAELKSKLKEQEHRLTMLDKKSMTAHRPALSHAAEIEVPHAKAFSAYLRSGDDDGLRGLEIEYKGMSTAVAADGGYLVDPATAETVQSVLRSTSSLRSIANVVTVDASAYDVLIDHADMGAGWADETTASSETSTPQLDRISIPLHELSALPKASQRLLDDVAFDVEAWLAERIADKFSRAEAISFISGDGVNKPRGILTYTEVDNDAWTWGNIGYVATGASGDFAASNPADAIVDLVFALGARYRHNASFVMNSKTAGAVRKMKDADGRFLWSDSMNAGEPARLMGYPVLIAEDM
jgi:HK97 family phage major capsid protein